MTTRISPTDRLAAADLAFAKSAVIYLERQGIEPEDVVRCLIDELEMDRQTAEALALAA